MSIKSMGSASAAQHRLAPVVQGALERLGMPDALQRSDGRRIARPTATDIHLHWSGFSGHLLYWTLRGWPQRSASPDDLQQMVVLVWTNDESGQYSVDTAWTRLFNLDHELRRQLWEMMRQLGGNGRLPASGN